MLDGPVTVPGPLPDFNEIVIVGTVTTTEGTPMLCVFGLDGSMVLTDTDGNPIAVAGGLLDAVKTSATTCRYTGPTKE